MEKLIQKKYEDLLTTTKEVLMASLVSESNEFEAIVDDMDPKDLADLAADDIDKKTLEALNQKDLRKLRLIDSALSRVKNGRYGLCMRCGTRIPEERLEAIPYALMCIDCKSTEERKLR
ncbi:MAG: TraR/DksA family transcriptional regulator [Spirochaetales bacterium]|nr:TraR/DksA family transcriptional regulator [Spirochaetales bacterium]